MPGAVALMVAEGISSGVDDDDEGADEVSHASRKLDKIKAKEELAQIKAQEKGPTLHEIAERLREAEAQQRRERGELTSKEIAAQRQRERWQAMTPEQRKRSDHRAIILFFVGLVIVGVVVVLLIRAAQPHGGTGTGTNSPSVPSGNAKCEASYNRLVDNGTPPINGHDPWIQYCLNGGPDGTWPDALPDP